MQSKGDQSVGGEQGDASSVGDDAVDAFIRRWSAAGGSERANYQLFLTELCSALELPQPEPAGDQTEDNAYVFERRVDIHKPDGTSTRGYIDLFKRDCFVLEAKQTGKVLDTDGWDKAMLKAQNQADQYVRALPAGEGRPPFIVVTDVGRSLELYAEFSRSGGTYVPFPDPGHHRIRLEDLREEDVQSRLRALWSDADSLDPSKHAAQVTRAVSGRLAELARSLEHHGYEVQRVAHFLKRCLFTMFSEDVGLLPEQSFTKLLETQRKDPEHFADALRALWESMNTGGYSPLLNTKVRRFNGGLFQDVDPIPLDADQIGLLCEAAKADWRYVEPAIFGTLLERALDPRERHKLGAHYTPRAYVERLVIPTLIDPLRDHWRTAQVAAEAWLQQGKTDKAVGELREFHHQLCQIRVLDPACGSGNFLYVALEHMKRLEGEVLNLIGDLTAGQSSFDTEGLTVDPHQFLGLELNPRAAAIAEIVLWIGYLQWHHRIHGKLDIPDPVLRDFQNIQHRDALIEYDSREPELDGNGDSVRIWDGIGMKINPTTGELIPDETSLTTVYRYHNPRRADWPAADFIVGNPPFIGEKRMRDALGDGYVSSVRSVYGELPACDFVMYWWHRAAELVGASEVNQFGLITTNSIGQTKNRAVTAPHLKKSVHIRLAVPDHPWVDGNDGAAVRIAMTIVSRGEGAGVRLQISEEWSPEGSDSRQVLFAARSGKVFPDLGVGAALVEAEGLSSNAGMVFQGVKLVGNGFLVSPEQRAEWVALAPDLRSLLPQLVAGSDLTKRRPPRYCIDFFGLDADSARTAFPQGFQKILSDVKPFRDQVRRQAHRDRFWIYGESRPAMRRALEGLRRYIVTSEVAKHRLFVFLDTGSALADGSLAVVATDDAMALGVLTSRLHVCWALAQGGRMGVGNDSRWQNGRCFLNFPFPDAPTDQANRIIDLADRIDAHRKQQQARHPGLTLTDMYNVLDMLNAGEPIHDKPKEKGIYEQGLVELLKELHDELDRAVFEVYGWLDLADVLVGRPGGTTPLPDKPEDQIEAEELLLTRLVELNAQRAGEEAQGQVRWLRPEYQSPDSKQMSAGLVAGVGGKSTETAAGAPAVGKQTWPKSIREQIDTVRSQLATAPQTTDALVLSYKRKPLKSVTQVLAALEGLGHIQNRGDVWYLS